MAYGVYKGPISYSDYVYEIRSPTVSLFTAFPNHLLLSPSVPTLLPWVWWHPPCQEVKVQVCSFDHPRRVNNSVKNLKLGPAPGVVDATVLHFLVLQSKEFDFSIHSLADTLHMKTDKFNHVLLPLVACKISNPLPYFMCLRVEFKIFHLIFFDQI